MNAKNLGVTFMNLNQHRIRPKKLTMTLRRDASPASPVDARPSRAPRLGVPPSMARRVPSFTLSVMSSLSRTRSRQDKGYFEMKESALPVTRRFRVDAASNGTLTLPSLVAVAALFASVPFFAQARDDAKEMATTAPSFTEARDDAIAAGTPVPSVAKPSDDPHAAAAPNPEVGRESNDALPPAPKVQPSDEANAVPAPVYYTQIRLQGRGALQPFYDLIVTWGNVDRWYTPHEEYTGPRGFVYRQYKNKTTGQCLDVKNGAATEMAELTTSPCDWYKTSQWWTGANGSLMPWHAAYQDLVATYYIPGGWLWNRLLLAPRFGPVGHADQQITITNHVIPH